MLLVEHLEELRWRIIKVGVAFVVWAVIAWFFRERLFELLLAPAPALGGELNVMGVAEALMTDVKLALWASLVLTLPVLLYQAWAFVVPAVGDLGRTFTYTLITLASLLFLAGVAFGYFVVLPTGINFLLEWAPGRFEPIITGDSYLSFVTRFLLALGLVFELPAATFLGAKLGLVDAPLMRRYRRHAIVANAILAAAITPGQDPIIMLLTAAPMLALYEIAILVARYVKPFEGVATSLESS